MSEIVFRDARYALNGSTLVGPLTFDVTRGETLVLLGASGSGKTTTLRLVNALVLPTNGCVTVNGRNTGDVDPVELRRNIGYMIQETGLLPHMTVAQNAGLVLRIQGIPPGDWKERADEMLALVGLDPGEFSQRYPHELSGGQRQRVGVARALAADPPLLLCDEPFGATDPVTRASLQGEFRALVRELGKTVVFVTHDVAEAVKLADRIAVLAAGRVEFIGPVEEFAVTDVAAAASLRNL